MSFKVSDSFISHETLGVTMFLELFQKCGWYKLKAALNSPPIARSLNVSVVSLLIDFLFEIQNVFVARLRACVCIDDVAQDYTCSEQGR
tara:strand:- start:110 stop:376 length:267 start_codon:yes stop_codon:yes gene_type:complete